MGYCSRAGRGGGLSVHSLHVGHAGTTALETTGASADIAVSEALHFGADGSFSAVPEPGTLFLPALVGLNLLRRKRR